jgi:hypothetical protein
MTRTEADEYRATWIWPSRPMTPFEPLPASQPPQPLRFAAPLRSHGEALSRSSCLAPPAALVTCWPRDKHRPS